MKSNLQLFRQSMKDYIPSQQIEDLQQFKQLVDHLCDNKLLHPLQVKKLIHKFSNSNDIKFPISFQQFQQIIMTQFGDKNLMSMIEGFRNLKLNLRQIKGVLNIWKNNGLTEKQRLELESIFQRGNSKIRQFLTTIQKQNQILGHIYQQEQQMIDSLDQWVVIQKVQQPFKHYQQYQAHHSKLIEQMYSKLRVREVHFKQRVNTAKIDKIETVVGLDSRNDQPVQVILIPKKLSDFDRLNRQLLTFNAKKELMLSRHFNRFLGYNTHTDSNCFLYFSEHIEGINLSEYISTANIQLEQETPLFKYWATMIYKSLYDVYLMCSYLPLLPLALKDFEVSNGGLKIVAKHIQFYDFRQQKEGEFYQASLLQNLAVLILGLLRIDAKQWSKSTKIKNIENKSIINCLLNAQLGHKHYKDGRVKSYLSFFKLSTHPLFESPNLLMGQTVIANFQKVLNYK